MKLVLSTCSPGEADGLARTLVEERLAACCNRLPGVSSTYWWEGRLTTDEEVLLVFKTRDDAVPALLARLRELHPYELPEMVVLAVADVHPPYASWVAAEVRVV